MSSPQREPPSRPKGQQPQYFDDPAIDQLHAALLISAIELSVAFDRIARGLSQRASLRRIAGALLLAFGLWTAGSALYHAVGRGGGHEQHHHG